MAIRTANLPNVDEVIFISDVHFDKKRTSLDWNQDIVDYFDNFFIPLINNEIIKKRNPVVVFAGDYFDNRNTVDIDVMNKATDTMLKIAEILPVYVMIGNHDIYKKNDTGTTSLRVIDHYKNIDIIKDKLVLSIKNERTFMLNSWVGDPSKENKIITKYKDKYDFLVFHTEISGMSYDNGRQITGGLNVSVLGDDCRILSGHIHKRQESKKALYFGSPYEITIEDMGNIKGIYTFYVNDSNEIVREFHENTYSPRQYVVEYNDYGSDLKKWAFIKNNYVKILFEHGQFKMVNVNKLSESLQTLCPRKLEFVEKSIKKTESEKEERTVKKDATLYDIFEEKVSEREVGNDFKETLFAFNKEYIKRAEEELAQ